MANNPNHRYAILDTRHGSRLLETAVTEAQAIARANVHTYRTGGSVQVIDRHDPIVRETRSITGGTRTVHDQRVIYETSGISAGTPAYRG